MSRSKRMDDLRELVKQVVRENELSTEGVISNKHFVFERFDDYSVVTIDDQKFKITGKERLKVVPYKEKKNKKVKESLPNKITKVCNVCGKEFEVSKFNRYFDECKECRKGKSSKVERMCEKCGNTFQTSKFTPYVNVCSGCVEVKKLNKKVESESV